jgi:hypothetical protein
MTLAQRMRCHHSGMTEADSLLAGAVMPQQREGKEERWDGAIFGFKQKS